ncbi:hypothetical protein [Rhodococcus sp. EPR-157]|uniref:hypothetical protein n=1 Tax=Rhodococcus sp. EPR-157 TaxID=1813677 RepID=UPI0012E75005|nr:hypothetical protein [Rhodococcus sp. EPR-157]
MPNVPNTPNTPNVPNTPNTPGAPNTPEAPGGPGTNNPGGQITQIPNGGVDTGDGSTVAQSISDTRPMTVVPGLALLSIAGAGLLLRLRRR